MNVGDASTVAAADPATNTLYIKKDAPKWMKEHELYHLRKRHPRHPKTRGSYVEQERDAYLHGYEKTGRPRVLRGEIRGIAADLHLEYNLPYNKAAKVVRKKFEAAKGTPKQWLEDARYVEKEADKFYESLKRKPYFCLTCNEWHTPKDKLHKKHIRAAEAWKS